MVVVVLGASGLQKLVHGYWLQGQFLAWSLWRPSFRTALAPLFAPDELARLGALGADAGDGPYLVTSPAVLLLSNATWSAEITLAALLVLRRTRAAAWVAAAVLVAITQAVAREMMFGVEFVAALVALRLELGPEVLFH